MKENRDSYVLKIPKSRLNAALEHAIVVPKKDCLPLDRGQTLVACLDRHGKNNLYHMDAHSHVVEENPLRLKRANGCGLSETTEGEGWTGDGTRVGTATGRIEIYAREDGIRKRNSSKGSQIKGERGYLYLRYGCV